MPLTGLRRRDDASLSTQNTRGRYWSSSPNDISGYYFTFASSAINVTYQAYRANGMSVRCLKN